MSDVPQDAPDHCPGTQSNDAGKSSACEGCPNQKVCAAGIPKQADPGVQQVKWRLASVKHKIIVLSGKGGVGKSTFTANLSYGLALEENRQVGVLDIDICGPSVPKIFGVEGEQVHQSGSGWSPVYVEDNLSVMSIGFLLESEEAAVIWRGPRKNGIIKQFLRDVDWGDIDYLVVDTPPGTSDEHLSLVQYLSETAVDGAIILTTPQEVSLIDVRKEIDFCRKVHLPILGVVENMSSFVCPKCQFESQPFPASTGGGKALANEFGLKFLGHVPIDPRLGQCCDEGKNFLTEHPDTPVALAYKNIINMIVDLCSAKEENSSQVDME